jgi:hypothetical protein
MLQGLLFHDFDVIWSVIPWFWRHGSVNHVISVTNHIYHGSYSWTYLNQLILRIRWFKFFFFFFLTYDIFFQEPRHKTIISIDDMYTSLFKIILWVFVATVLVVVADLPDAATKVRCVRLLSVSSIQQCDVRPVSHFQRKINIKETLKTFIYIDLLFNNYSCCLSVLSIYLYVRNSKQR